MTSQARPRTLYVLIFANLLLLLSSVALALYVQRLNSHVDQAEVKVRLAERSVASARVQVELAEARIAAAEKRGYASCVRGNVLREIARFAMKELGSPERARDPAVQEQPCAKLYPGGVS